MQLTVPSITIDPLTHAGDPRSEKRGDSMAIAVPRRDIMVNRLSTDNTDMDNRS